MILTSYEMILISQFYTLTSFIIFIDNLVDFIVCIKYIFHNYIYNFSEHFNIFFNTCRNFQIFKCFDTIESRRRFDVSMYRYQTLYALRLQHRHRIVILEQSSNGWENDF